jgi:transcriptional regulator with XRE-family HTH domain
MAKEPTASELTLGEIIRRQRELAELPMRQLAALAGISNPYLSQIERGLRAPSEHVLNAIADSLQMSADVFRTNRTEAGDASAVAAAIEADPDLSASQRRSLLEAYGAFRQVSLSRRKARGRHAR